MPTLSQHQSNEYTKMLIMGDSGSGKTGSLCSLVAGGYKLRIIDFDNGLDVLKQFIYKECPEKIDNVEYVTLQDPRKATPMGSVIDGAPKAFVNAIKLLDNWPDHGKPCEWGSEVILVIDSLTFMSNAAFDWREGLVAGKGSRYDKRAVYGDAQDAVENVLATIHGDNFRTNVIVIAHVKYIERDDGLKKGYPTSVGSALSPQIPAYFNTLALCETKTGGKRTIQTAATSMIDLKNPKPFAAKPTYDISTGLAEFFAVLRETPKPQRKLRSI